MGRRDAGSPTDFLARAELCLRAAESSERGRSDVGTHTDTGLRVGVLLVPGLV